MNTSPNPRKLDVAALSAAGEQILGAQPLSDFPRLVLEAEPSEGLPADAVGWRVSGRKADDGAGKPAVWLDLYANTRISSICQRCLAPMQIDLVVDRPFRFVADEATAAAQDEDSLEDLLVLDRDFDLLALIEDELLMAMPITPKHTECPSAPTLHAKDEGFDAADAARPNAFAALGELTLAKRGKSDLP